MGLRLDEQIKTLVGLQPEMLIALMVMEEVIESAEGKDLIITSVVRNTDKVFSYHANGYAFDSRIRHLNNPQRIVDIARSRLAHLGFDIILESDHIHCELDLKKAEK
jgi:hypothetical protein